LHWCDPDGQKNEKDGGNQVEKPANTGKLRVRLKKQFPDGNANACGGRNGIVDRLHIGSFRESSWMDFRRPSLFGNFSHDLNFIRSQAVGLFYRDRHLVGIATGWFRTS